MSDEERQDDLLELPLEHHASDWQTVEKGDEAPSDAPPSYRVPPRRPAAPRKRAWPWWVLAVLLLGLGYWLFWPAPPRVEFPVESAEFADQRVGVRSEVLELVIRNTGERPLEVAGVGVVGMDASDYVTEAEDCSGRLVEPEMRCTVAIAFAPLEMGSRQAQLEIVSNVRGGRALLPLAGLGVAPVLDSDPSRLDFGSEPAGAASPALDLQLLNSGTFPLQIQSVSVEGSAPEFSIVGNRCSGQTLPVDEGCRLQVVFKPRLLGRRSGVLRVRSDSHRGAGSIEMVGMGTGPDLAIDPPGLEFGSQLVGSSSEPLTLELTNRGDELFRFSSLSLESGASFEIVSENCSRRSLATGQSCSATVRFKPGREGAVESSLKIREASGGLAPGIGLAGTGVSPRAEFSATEIDFDGLVVETQGTTRRLEIANPGSATLAISEVRLTGAHAADFTKGRDGCSGTELASGRRCVVELQFRPRSGGDKTARLVLRSNLPGSSPQVALRGRGLAPELKLGRSRLDFAAVRQTESQDLRVDISNTGEAPLSFTGVRLSGTHAADFSLAADTCQGRQTEPAATCRLIVRFAPSGNGPRDARLLVTSNAPEGTVSLVLRGSGLPAPVPQLSFSPGFHDFGPRAVGQRSDVVTLTLRNTGEGRLVIAAIRLAGVDAADFRIVPGTCEGLPYLVPGGDCSVGVRFTASVPGSRSASLLIEHNAPGQIASIELQGEGL